ncbi:nucleotide pyrophosphatase [Bacilli bacterium]|nr:nucleotide pyrophosphatase [Bacilli bacterium]
MPNYNRSILTIPNSVLKHYGIEPYHPTLPELDALLAKNYRNVVSIIFDAMGTYILDNNIDKNSFLSKHKILELTSVFPSTTAVAITSLRSGLAPIEHGWLGKYCYFKEYDQCIELFKDREYYTRDPVSSSIVTTILDFEKITTRIDRLTEGEVSVHEIMPAFAGGLSTIEDVFSKVTEMCRNPGRNYISVYWDQPDETIHEAGCINDTIAGILNDINKNFEKTSKIVKDTIFIISADHGQLDAGNYIFLNELPKIDECLDKAPSVNERSMTFMLKNGTKDIFRERFSEIFTENDFILVEKEEYIKRFLGSGKPHYRADDFIGDFTAIGTGDKILMYKNSDRDAIKINKAYHSGLTEQEMVVPLIICECG